jgi:hypothetical protein
MLLSPIQIVSTFKKRGTTELLHSRYEEIAKTAEPGKVPSTQLDRLSLVDLN